MSASSRTDGEPTHQSGKTSISSAATTTTTASTAATTTSTDSIGSNDSSNKTRGPGTDGKGGDGATMAPKLSQKISILVFRGHPEDSVDTRVAKLHLDFDDNDDDEKRAHGGGHVVGDVTFEIRSDAQRREAVVRELANQGPPSQRPHFLREIDVATVPVSSELDTTLRDLIRGVSPNPEWDDRNWVDDVLRVLQAAWPSQINNSDVTYALNFMVDVLYHG